MTRRADFTLRQASVANNGTPAVAGVDLRIDPGEAVAVVGPSGAGKTTLLRLLNATVRPNAGSVAVTTTSLKTVVVLGPALATVIV